MLNSNNAEEVINSESLENKNNIKTETVVLENTNNNTIINSNEALFPKEKRFLLEFKPAYFFYQDKMLKDIFGYLRDTEKVENANNAKKKYFIEKYLNFWGD